MLFWPHLWYNADNDAEKNALLTCSLHISENELHFQIRHFFVLNTEGAIFIFFGKNVLIWKGRSFSDIHNLQVSEGSFPYQYEHLILNQHNYMLKTELIFSYLTHDFVTIIICVFHMYYNSSNPIQNRLVLVASSNTTIFGMGLELNIWKIPSKNKLDFSVVTMPIN